MIQQVLRNFPHIWLTVLGLVLFFSVFIGALLWINRRSAAALYQEVERYPLEERGEI